jgi:hypothetical protein
VPADLDFLGFPIRLQGAGERRQWRGLLGSRTSCRSHATPALTIEFGPALEPPRRPRAAGVLVGDGFILDYPSRLLRYPLAAPRSVAIGRTTHLLLPRTICLALALLAERAGPRAVACAGASGQAPLYLHASAVAGSRGALLFCGRSTYGKTTIARTLLSRYRQLEDDQALALAGPFGRRACAAPRLVVFTRGRAPATLPIAGIFWLEKARTFELEPLPRAEAAALLLEPVLSGEELRAVANRLRVILSLVSAIPCWRLQFRKERAPLVALLRAHGVL